MKAPLPKWRPPPDCPHYGVNERMAKKDFRIFLIFMSVVLIGLGFVIFVDVG